MNMEPLGRKPTLRAPARKLIRCYDDLMDTDQQIPVPAEPTALPKPPVHASRYPLILVPLLLPPTVALAFLFWYLRSSASSCDGLACAGIGIVIMFVCLGVVPVATGIAGAFVVKTDRLRHALSWFAIAFTASIVAVFVIGPLFTPPERPTPDVHATIPDARSHVVVFDDGSSVGLVDGKGLYPRRADGTPINETVLFFGNEATGDINGDGIPDIAHLITVDPGGSGTFYYVAVVVSDETGWNGDTPAVLLGDRIAPQTTEIRNGMLIVNYADREPDQPFSAPPTVNMSKFLVVRDGRLVDAGPVVPMGSTPVSASPVACTQEAMQCPDGTWVGRTGPRCEFVCP